MEPWSWQDLPCVGWRRRSWEEQVETGQPTGEMRAGEQTVKWVMPGSEGVRVQEAEI